MTEHLASLHLSDHSAGCPTSPAEPLWLPDHPGLCLLAHGAQSACAVVKVAQEGHDYAGGPAGQRSERPHVLIPPVVLRLSPASAAETAVSVVAWCSQGTESKLAAVAGTLVAIFSLEQYITAIIQQTPAIQPHPGQAPTCQAQHSTPLVAVSWTQEGDGLLSADAEGGIIMWKLYTKTDGTQQLTQAWIGGSSTVVQPQTILTAGANILSPSASACPGSKHVTIWWPEEIHQSGDQPAAAAPLPKGAEGSAMVAVAEQLKHPVGVVNAQWSPGSLQHGSSFTGNDQDGSPLAANAQPALMTVGYDGMIRIWVEVTLSPSLGAPGSPSRLTGPSTPTTPGTPQNLVRGHQLVGSSQFCMTLVVQPPNGTLIGFQPDSLRACWGMPCQEPLGPANRMAAGSVLWILAMVHGSQQAKAPSSTTGAQGPSDQLLLWAVEGLAGVVINGIPNNVPGTRALNTPRAVLWGQHDDLLTWPGQHSSPIAERQLACSVFLQDGTPLLHVVESCTMPEHGGITLRKYAIHSVDEDTAMVAAQRATSATAAIPPRQLPLHDFSTQAITGHHHPITCLATHSSQPLALTADEAGSAMLWHTQPLTPLGRLAGVLVGSSASNAQSKIVAACWLHTDVHPSSADATVGVLAAASNSRIWLVEVDLAGSSSSSSSKDMGQNLSTQLLGAADIPDGYQFMESLCTLPQDSRQTADYGCMEHLLVGSLSQRHHPEAQMHAQTESPAQVSGSALGIWQVVVPAGATVAKSGQDQGQGQGQQPQRKAQLKLLNCHKILQDSAETLTCVVAASEAKFQLMTGSSEGAVHLFKTVDAQSAELTTLKQLHSIGRVCDMASIKGGSHIAAVTQAKTEHAGFLQVWQAESAPPDARYSLDASIRFSDHPTAVAWLPSCAVSLAVVVACLGSTQIFAQAHAQGWISIASLGNLVQPMRALQLGHNGSPMVTAGNQLGLVSNLVQAHHSSSSGHPSQLLQIPVAQLVLELAGPLPDYAPAALAILVARGRMTAAREAFRHLLVWLQMHDSSTQTWNASALQQQLLPDVPLDALLDKTHLGALLSLVESLPVSSRASESNSVQSAVSTTQQQQQKLSQRQGSAAASAQLNSGPAPSSSSSKAQMQSTLSPAPVDPYAFNLDAFGPGNDAEEEQPLQPAAMDPFAFDAGGFGMDNGAEEEEREEQQVQPKAAAKDPYAFDAGAFGMAQEEEEDQAQPMQAASSDPFAFDAGAFGMPTFQPEEDEGQEAEEQKVSQPAVDPFAFDPGAFGFSGEEQHDQAGAFGMDLSPEPAQESATQEEPAQPAQQAQSETDPFAFDSGALGLDPSISPAPKPSQPPAKASRPAPAAKNAAQKLQTEVNQSSSKASPGQTASKVQGQRPSAAIQIFRPKQQSSSTPHSALLSSSELGDLQRLLGTALSQSKAQDSGQEPVSPNSPAGALINLDLAGPPLPPGLTPHDTQALLGIAQMLCDDPPETAPSSQRSVAEDAEQGASIPGMGHIPVDWPALDEAARKAVRAVQLAVCSMHSLSASSDSQGSGVAAHQSREVLDGLMAGPRPVLPASTSDTAEKQLAVASESDGSWGGQVGLLMGLSSSALMWALLSENQNALLMQTINQLPVVTLKGELAPPEFGFSTSSASTGGPREAPLTWEAMRQVGAGFWLTDPQVVLARAEALAKAQFARSRDAHDCALMYVALKKKQLLLSLFRGGNHKKLADFLMRDFRQDKHKDAACKNAFTLLGQHRYELAAAFFVLGGALQDAVGVCAHELGDPQLALFLARLLEGEQGPLQQALLAKELLPGAQARKDTWAECLLTWLQGQPAEALQGLMAPCEPDQENSHSSDRSLTPGQLNTNPASVSGRDQSTSSSSSKQATPFITKANQHTPDRSSAHSAAHESSGVPSPQNISFQASGQWDKALALDLVSHCLASGVNTWPGQLPSLGQLCQLAVEASHALEVTGHPVMALEALQIAQMCSKRLASQNSKSGSDHSTQGSSQSSTPTFAHDSQHQQQPHILSSWQERLVTACLVRCLVDATAPVPPLDPLLSPGAPLNPQDAQHFISQRWTLHRNRALATAPLPDAGQWKKLAQQQLRVMSDAGIQVNTDQAMARLQTVRDSLSPLTLVEGEEAVGAEVGSTALFRSISGMSAMSTPRRDSTLSSGAYSSASGAVFDESHRLLYVDSDRLHAVCASNAGVFGYAGADGRPFAAASVKHGIVVGEASLVTWPSHRHSQDGRPHPSSASDAGSKGTTFSAMLGDMLEAVRWPQDPTPAPGSPFSRAGSKGGKPESPTATRVRVPVGQIGTSTLAAHPTRQLFLTGCSTGEIYLCQFGDTKAKAGYTPMPGHLEAPAPSPQSLFTTPPKSWNPSPGVNFTHWGQPQAVCWSDDGERFAGLGDGGVVATWRLDAPRMQASDTGYLGRSDWCHQGLSKRGMDLTYLGNGSSVVAVAGQCSQGGNIVIWDLHRPLTSGPVARLSYHMAAVTSLKVLPGSQLLASADEQGSIAVKDLRMLGGSTQQPPRGSASRGLPPPMSTLSAGQVSGSSWGAYSGNAAARGLVWEVRGAHQGQAVVRMAAGLRPLADGTTGGSMLVTGGRDGSINVWSCHRGRHLQTIHKAHLTNAHSSKGRNFFTDAFRSKSSNGAPAIVTGLSLTADGLLSCGLDGYVKLHPFL
ncbi:hypothetical protein WJX77_001067 [Trebouxia sp. C0004]